MNTYAVFADGQFYWSGTGFRQVMDWAKALKEKGYGQIQIQRIAPEAEYRALGPMRSV